MGAFGAQYDQAGTVPGQPIPIRPHVAAPGEYPLEALSPLLESAARAIVDKVQLPASVAAASVLATASLAVQPYVDVAMPTGEIVPTSLFFVSSSESGDRKSSADKLALFAVRSREAEMREDYAREQTSFNVARLAYEAAKKKATQGTNKTRQQIESELAACGKEPLAPALPVLLVDEPTMPALQKMFAEAMPALGLFSDEGGTLLGGHAMNAENRIQTGGVLSKLWDGAPIKRVRASEVVTFLPGRRLAMHLMMQPRVARKLLGDPDMKAQGLLSRILVCQPTSMKGDRLWRDPLANSNLDLEKYHARVMTLLRGNMPMNLETRELRPLVIELSPEARDLFIHWHDAIELELKKGGAFEDIAGFAGKLPEHSLRIAAVMSYFQNKEVRPITPDALARAIKIAKFHAAEALRLFGIGTADEDTENASAIITWIREQSLQIVGTRFLTRNGPGRSLSGPQVKRAIGLMLDLKHLVEIDGGAEVTFRGKTERQRQAWAVIADDEP